LPTTAATRRPRIGVDNARIDIDPRVVVFLKVIRE
jgi:hypothetical protein